MHVCRPRVSLVLVSPLRHILSLHLYFSPCLALVLASGIKPPPLTIRRAQLSLISEIAPPLFVNCLQWCSLLIQTHRRTNVLSLCPDAPDSDFAPVFRVQATFIKGGVLESIYLHHSVGDAGSLGLLMCRPLSGFQGEDLATQVKEESRRREVLLDSKGAELDLCKHSQWRNVIKSLIQGKHFRGISASGETVRSSKRSGIHDCAPQPHACPKKLEESHNWRSVIFSFTDARLKGLKEKMSEILPKEKHSGSFENAPYLSTEDCLKALLWMRITHARAHLLPDLHNHENISMLGPVTIRGRMVAEDSFGNACSLNTTALPFNALEKPLSDLPALCRVASAIRRAILEVDDEHVRSAIAVVNEVDDVRMTNLAELDLRRDVVGKSLKDLPVGRRISAWGWARRCG
jgi:hypothetical protein